MDAQVVNSFIEGTFHILDTTASVKGRPEKPYLKQNRAESNGAITGLLKLNGEIDGTVSLTFSEKCILDIVSTMFGEEMPLINEEIRDAVGEIGNMISGHVNTKMADAGMDVKVTLAGVEDGIPHVIGHSDGKSILVLPFKTTKGNLFIEVCY